MRTFFAALPLLALAACGGASGPQSAGGIAPPTGGTGTPAPTPTPPPVSGGPGGGVTPGTGTGTGTPTPTPSQFLDVGAETTFSAIGAFQSLGVTESGISGLQGPKLYQGNASTVRAPSGTVTYNPRDGIFTINFAESKAGVVTNSIRFQDPGHRTNTPFSGVPDLAGFNYLEAKGGTQRPAGTDGPTDLGRIDEVTFFYQRPGAQTNYVSLGGYVRNAFDLTADRLVAKAKTESLFQRGAFVFGEETLRSQVPITGVGTYTGGLLATMVVNTAGGSVPNYFQWITGRSDIVMRFSDLTMTIELNGKVSPVMFNGETLAANVTGVAADSLFRAVGAGAINLTASGGFTGQFSSVSFTRPDGTTLVPVFDRVNPNSPIAGANSIDGTYFGPQAVNVGGNFRIVGGQPEQRVDIMGAFTGAKK